MPDAITLGPFAIPSLLFSGLIALGTGSIILRFFLPRVFNRDIVDWIAGRTSAALLLGLLTWKIWPIFRWWDQIRVQPGLLLRMPGGIGGVLAGTILAVIVITPGLMRYRERIKPLILTITISGLAFAFTVAGLQSVHGISDLERDDLHTALSRVEYAGARPISDPGGSSRPLVVTFWATWCGPCVAELPVKAEFYRRFSDEIDYIAINMTRTESSRASVSRFITENGMDYPVALDEDGRLSALFGVRGTPTTVVVDTDGTVINRWMGASSLDRLERTMRRLVF